MNNFADLIGNIQAWPFTIIASLIAILGGIYLFRLKTFSDASAAFRAAFADALLRLNSSRDATSTIIFQNHSAHLAAILAFMSYVPRHQRIGFERAAKEYSLQANIQNAKGPLEGLIFDGAPEGQEQRSALLQSIHHLLSFAKGA